MQCTMKIVVTVFSAEQDTEKFRAGLLAGKVNGLAAMQGGMALERVILSILKHRIVAAIVLLGLQRSDPAAASVRIIGSDMCATL